ncbi:MAG: EAL domain-containing protein, partial [Acetobacter sp.]|nr:EAL domain-containing protein [Acetobacter sp.]
DMTCCAEGVETEEQLGFLDAHDCEEIQGFLIGRPAIAMPFDRPSST